MSNMSAFATLWPDAVVRMTIWLLPKVPTWLLKTTTLLLVSLLVVDMTFVLLLSGHCPGLREAGAISRTSQSTPFLKKKPKVTRFEVRCRGSLLKHPQAEISRGQIREPLAVPTR